MRIEHVTIRIGDLLAVACWAVGITLLVVDTIRHTGHYSLAAEWGSMIRQVALAVTAITCTNHAIAAVLGDRRDEQQADAELLDLETRRSKSWR